jgi:DNA-binding beta-propeller fold protein YncE
VNGSRKLSEINSICNRKLRKPTLVLLGALLVLSMSLVSTLSARGQPSFVVATIPVGRTPVGIATNIATNMIYAVNEASFFTSQSDSVSVINGVTNTVVATIPSVGIGSEGLGRFVNHVTNRIYVSSMGNCNTGCSTPSHITVIDGASNTVKATILMPAGTCSVPRGIAVNEVANRIYYAGAVPFVAGSSGCLGIIDGLTNTIVRGISLFPADMNPSRFCGFQPCDQQNIRR